MSKYKDIFDPKIILFEGMEDIDEKEIWLPEPPNLTDVINYKQPTAKQKFTPNQIPKDLSNLVKHFKPKRLKNGRVDPTDTQYNYLTTEMNQWILNEYETIFGTHWCFIHGKLYPIPGYQYHGCAYWTAENGQLLSWLYKDWLWYVHWQYDIEKDPKCYGMVEMTGRRGGKSTRAMNTGWVRTFAKYGQHLGIQSKTKKDAEELMQKGIVNPMKKLPFYLRPLTSTGTNPREEIRLEDNAKRGAGAFLEEINELEGWVMAGPSSEKYFDGKLLHTYVGDEEGKTEEADVLERHEIVKPTQVVMGEIVGKSIHTTTVEEMKKKGGDAWKKLWDRSYRNTEDYKITGETVSGLHQHFTSSTMNLMHDAYGFPKEEEALKEINSKRNSLRNNPASLIKYKRKYPLSVREAMMLSGNACPFNVNIITTRQEYYLFDKYKDLRRGRFEWKNNEPDTEVEWIDDPEGPFLASYLFEDPNDANNVGKNNKGFHPMNNLIMGGADPYMYDVVEGKGSKGAAAWFMDRDKILDPTDHDTSSWTSYRFICTYVDRPRNKKIYAEDLIKACFYYGSYMYPENNVDTVEEKFKLRGYKQFLYYDRNSQGRKKQQAGAKNTGDDLKDDIFDELEHYIDKFGYKEKHPELLEAWLEVDYHNLSPHDLFVASGYAILGAKRRRLRFKNKHTDEKENRKNNRSFVKTYVVD